ncbi:MAG: hypothetical protein S4CHLAM123_15560 [Chlamydiales bacterium]|nr:hypothetical protein [Chlamydiales bacterium]
MSRFFTLHADQLNIVSTNQISITGDDIFVEIGDGLCQVAQIVQDESGFYVPRTDFWIMCPRGHSNPPWRVTCQVCGLALY